MNAVRLFYKACSKLLRFLGFQDVVIIEIDRGTRANTRAVFYEILRRGWDKRFRIVLLSIRPEDINFLKTKHVSVMKMPQYSDRRSDLWPVRWLTLRARLIIDENKQIKKKNEDTIHVYLSHGSPIKRLHDYYNCTPDTDYALCQSEFWRPIDSYEFIIPDNRLVIKGFPRNDELFSSDISVRSLFGERFQRIIAWYPTFRQHNSSDRVLCTESSGLPILHDEDAARRVNELAARYGILLVVKPHPVQDVSRVKALNLDHVMFITDEFFMQHGLTSYEFLGNSDALITDYSSVVFDYLLTGKPIALAQEDYEEYEKKVGFAINMDILRSCVVNLEKVDDFEPFFRDLVEENDLLREKRTELMHLTNQYTDGNSTKRVVDWLETLLNEKLL